VSNSSDVVVSPRRTVTSAANPCSATRPTRVRPSSNCGAATSATLNGIRRTRSSLGRSPSKTLSTSVVTRSSSTGASAIGSTAAPGAGRGTATPAAALDASHMAGMVAGARSEDEGQNTGTATSRPASTAPAVLNVARLTRKCCVSVLTSRSRRCSGESA
jgi:hypothetical protein